MKIFRILIVSALLCVCSFAHAQTNNAYGSYSPYTVFGFGNIHREGTAYNKSMGGVGIATRNKRFINFTNPAAIAAIDSCSFMADFGLTESNVVFRQAGKKSANNTFNISDFVMSFPIYRSSAFMIGITPFSSIGYNFSDYGKDTDIIAQTGNYNVRYYGEGSVYQLFAGAGATFWKRLSVGAEFIFYFGTLDKNFTHDFVDASIRDQYSGSTILVRGVTGKFGLQYEQPVSSTGKLTFGATYRLRSSMSGNTTQYNLAELSSIQDTISYNVTPHRKAMGVGDELGVGVSFRSGDKWSVEFDYLRSDWGKSNVNNPSVMGYTLDNFSTSVSQSFRAGFEVVPNRNDIRYYMKRVAYRGGVYYDQEYYKFNGNTVSSKGVTLGVTFPVYMFYNGISVGIDVGQRGSIKNNMVKETYVTFSVGFNIHDLWFIKPRYE